MIVIKTKVLLTNLKAKQIYHWWLNLDNTKYTQWHTEHVYWEWKKAAHDYSVRFGEKIDNFNINFKGYIARKKNNNSIIFKSKALPVYVFLRFKNMRNSGTLVNYKLILGSRKKYLKFLDIILEKTLVTNSFKKALVRHVHEEHKLLKDIII